MTAKKKTFPLRLDPDIHRAVEQWANDEFRSVNAHIEYLLREALKRAGRLPPKERKAGGEGGADGETDGPRDRETGRPPKPDAG